MKNEILVISIGTSCKESRVLDIGGIEDAVAGAFPDWSVKRAFVSRTIIDKILLSDGEHIDDPDQALKREIETGVERLVILPTCLMRGTEYDRITGILEKYSNSLKITVAEPLLNLNIKTVLKAVTEEEARDTGTALVLLGHGTDHSAGVCYDRIAAEIGISGLDNVFIGTVEEKPKETSKKNVLEKIKKAGCKNVVLRPLMVTAGKHVTMDMAGDDPYSWKSFFEKEGCFKNVACRIEGLGRIDAIKKIYVSHTLDAIKINGRDNIFL